VSPCPSLLAGVRMRKERRDKSLRSRFKNPAFGGLSLRGADAFPRPNWPPGGALRTARRNRNPVRPWSQPVSDTLGAR
jgi:hypothetical protein